MGWIITFFLLALGCLFAGAIGPGLGFFLIAALSFGWFVIKETT